MYRLFVLAGLLALVGLVASAQVQADDKDKDTKKPKSIGAIMKKAHAGDDALRTAVTKALKDKDFKKAAEPIKAWVVIASHLDSFKPPKGNANSWKKQTKKYAANVKSLAKAIQDKDEDDAAAKLKTVNEGCGACHRIHRPKKK